MEIGVGTLIIENVRSIVVVVAIAKVEVRIFEADPNVLRDGRFDFQFSHDKVFRTYEALGAVRSDLRLVLGRNLSRAGFSQLLPRNRIIGLGSGFGLAGIVWLIAVSLAS